MIYQGEDDKGTRVKGKEKRDEPCFVLSSSYLVKWWGRRLGGSEGVPHVP